MGNGSLETRLRERLQDRAERLRNYIQHDVPMDVVSMGATMELLESAADALAEKGRAVEQMRELDDRLERMYDMPSDSVGFWAEFTSAQQSVSNILAALTDSAPEGEDNE